MIAGDEIEMETREKEKNETSGSIKKELLMGQFWFLWLENEPIRDIVANGPEIPRSYTLKTGKMKM